MIDKATGNIIVSSLIQVKYNDHLQDIVSLEMGQTRTLLNLNNGWIWLNERNVLIDNLYFAFQFGFFDDRLKELSFCFSDRELNSNESWDNWSKDKELYDLERYEIWLAVEFGGRRDFDWGNVWASYDAKSGASSIGIRFR